MYHLHAGASEGAEGGLCAGAGGLGLVTTGGAHLDVQGGDAQFLKNRAKNKSRTQRIGP